MNASAPPVPFTQLSYFESLVWAIRKYILLHVANIDAYVFLSPRRFVIEATFRHSWLRTDTIGYLHHTRFAVLKGATMDEKTIHGMIDRARSTWMDCAVHVLAY